MFDFPCMPHPVGFDSSLLTKRTYRCNSEISGEYMYFGIAVLQFSFINRYRSFSLKSLLIHKSLSTRGRPLVSFIHERDPSTMFAKNQERTRRRKGKSNYQRVYSQRNPFQAVSISSSSTDNVTTCVEWELELST